ncbi:MAG: hypothetical protein CNE98_07535 [Bacteroidetes bacterium MED-G17]|nr:MAG: hypothetical protein CNE98_07535 [Bacteroidetes bacterium MED-G17]|tara:strand:- start:8134 stop:8466 length:333 start_codon:yes stop_codon:yes gene_type:complete
MQSQAAIEKLQEIIKKSNKKFDSEWISSQLLAVRELAKEEKDPTVIKILRLASEFIQENEHFDLGFFEEEEEEMEISEFEYLLQLIIQAEKPANREEITLFRDLLWASLY